MKIISSILIAVALMFSSEENTQYSYEKIDEVFVLKYIPSHNQSKDKLLKIRADDSYYGYVQEHIYAQLIQCDYQKRLSKAFSNSLPMELCNLMRENRINIFFKIDLCGNVYNIQFKSSKSDFRQFFSDEWMNMIVGILQTINVSLTLDETLEELYKGKVDRLWVDFTFPHYLWE